MGKGKNYTYQGFTGTISEIIDHFNLDIKPKTVHERINSGMSVEESFEKEVSPHKKVYEYRGYKGSVEEIIEYFNLGIKAGSIRARLMKGFSISEAIEKPFKKTSKTFYNYGGFTASLDKIVKHFDLPVSSYVLRKRIRSGETIEEAIKNAIEDKKNTINISTIFTYKGYSGTVKQLIKEFDLGISYPYTLLDKIKKHNGSVEKAIEEIKNNAHDKYFYKGEFRTLTAIANIENISLKALKKKLDSENTKEIESVIEIIKTNKRTICVCRDGYKGSINQCMKHLHIEYKSSIHKKLLSKIRHQNICVDDAWEIILTEKEKNRKYELSDDYSGTLKECLNKLNIKLNTDSISYSRLVYILHDSNLSLEEAILVL